MMPKFVISRLQVRFLLLAPQQNRASKEFSFLARFLFFLFRRSHESGLSKEGFLSSKYRQPIIQLQQFQSGGTAGGQGVVVPQADLYLTHMGFAQQQHAQAALADTAPHGQGKCAVQQHFVEG